MRGARLREPINQVLAHRRGGLPAQQGLNSGGGAPASGVTPRRKRPSGAPEMVGTMAMATMACHRYDGGLGLGPPCGEDAG